MSPPVELSPSSRRLVVAGTMLGLLVAASNQTVVSTALPRIVADLHGLNLLSWVFASYMLTSTTAVPIAGKLSDMFGRKPFFLGGIVLFLAASAAAGASQTMVQLIVLRGIQGFGGGMLMSSAFTVIADLFPPAERGRYQGLFTSTFALSSIVGPTIGGTLTDHLSWRAVFYMNLPIGLAALAILGAKLPGLARPPGKQTVDYAGVALLSGGIVALLLALVWGGDVYAWASPEIAALLGAAALMLVVFLHVEARAVEPLLPLYLFRIRVVAVGSLLIFLTGVMMTGILTFMPIFLQAVLGASATNSGLVLSPMMLAVVLASNLSGQMVSRSGRYRRLIILGGAVLLGGMFTLSRFGTGTSWPQAVAGMALVGTGIGLGMPLLNLAVQSSVGRRHLGVATSSSQFFRQIGATLGVAVFGTLVATGIHSNLERNLSGTVTSAVPAPLVSRLEDADVVLSPNGRQALAAEFAALGPEGEGLFDEALAAVRLSVSDALTGVFSIGFAVAAATLALAFFLPDQRLATSWAEAAEAPRPEGAAAEAPARAREAET